MRVVDQNELQKAFEAYVRAVDEIARSGDWARFADMFTQTS